MGSGTWWRIRALDAGAHPWGGLCHMLSDLYCRRHIDNCGRLILRARGWRWETRCLEFFFFEEGLSQAHVATGRSPASRWFWKVWYRSKEWWIGGQEGVRVFIGDGCTVKGKSGGWFLSERWATWTRWSPCPAFHCDYIRRRAFQ